MVRFVLKGGPMGKTEEQSRVVAFIMLSEVTNGGKTSYVLTVLAPKDILASDIAKLQALYKSGLEVKNDPKGVRIEHTCQSDIFEARRAVKKLKKDVENCLCAEVISSVLATGLAGHTPSGIRL